MVRMAVARARELQPLKTSEVPVNHAALIIGGGIAGMTAALTLADQGFPVHLIEREEQLGGNLRNLRYFLPVTASPPFPFPSPQEYLAETVTQVTRHPLLQVFTQHQVEDFLANQPAKISDIQSLVMIQCVGPGEKYCSRLCCTTALKNALKLKELNPQAQITLLYRDIRTYGFKERLYTEARRVGVRFIHYDFDRKPIVRVSEQQPRIPVEGGEPLLG